SARQHRSTRLGDVPFSAGSSPTHLTDLADGQHTFTVRATDTAGNIGTATHTWRIDTTDPRVALTDKPAALPDAASASFGFTATDNDLQDVSCRADDGTFPAC